MTVADRKTTAAEWVSRMQQGDLRALSRMMSSAENRDRQVLEVLSLLHGRLGHARIMGITGPPGAGKSTLTGAFLRQLRARGHKVAVVAVDPVSPFSGGALLGDRIRLVDHFNDPGVFIRSLSTRGKLGGLSGATRQVVALADAFGFDDIIVETVGVGQSEVDVRRLADVTLVVLVPEWGDSIQAIKAGLLEIGDVFAVNKADREGADRIVNELRVLCQIAHREDTPILTASSREETSQVQLLEALEKFIERNAELVKKRRKAAGPDTVREVMEAMVLEEMSGWLDRESTEQGNPYSFLVDFSRQHPPGTLFSK